MSTRSLIAMKEAPKTKGGQPILKVIYCHWDGYPSNNGKLLLENYKTPEKVRALMNLGDISSLGPDLGEQHDFDAPIEEKEGVCTAYGRDRGEKDCKAKTFKFKVTESDNLVPKVFEKEANDSWCEWVYVFDEENGGWEFSPVSKPLHFKRLTKAACSRD